MAELDWGSTIMEKDSPVEEKVVSSTPVMRAPSATRGTHGAQEMVSTRCGARVGAGVALTDGEAGRSVLDLEVVQHNRL